ncbi:glycosyltransferase [Bacillus sp. EB600]|uniref:glycosyltransferase n=1 Tax=Bacillus sp. EB600 TaxID=2806345 RepID=UPI00210BC52D|nr:glycosyltransferase [Bacillus sp. EB600]MCQ6280006.1 glycosyltransferase [Bacillus sp. EB600]
MKVSVVMTTYNGEKYIYEQIKSIYKQTQSPDEVIICDDCSSDSTVTIVKEFIVKHSLNNWMLFVNKENKGWQKNFIEAMGKSTGDVIFLCDQDDIWLDDKIEHMVNAMKCNDQIKCLAGNIITIDDSGQVFNNKHGYAQSCNTNIITKIPFNKKFNTITILGCSLCLTREIAEIIRDLDVKNFSHDAQTCRLANLLDGTYLIDRPVIKYRIHSNNTSGVSANVGFGSTSLEKRISTINGNIQWLKALLKYYQSNKSLPDYKLRVISKTREMQEKRYDFLTSRSLAKYIGLIKYKNYYSDFSMLIGDFAYCYGINKMAGTFLWALKTQLKMVKGK